MKNIFYDDYKPILVVPAVPIDNKIRFYCPNTQIDISAPISFSVWKVVSFCNGFRTIAELKSIINDESINVHQIIVELDKLGILCDSSNQHLHFHRISSNPQVFTHSLSTDDLAEQRKSYLSSVKNGCVFTAPTLQSRLFELQLNRKSCRSFLSKGLTCSQLLNICYYSYSSAIHSTPSGGGLYPLRLFCIVTHKQVDLPKGYYEYDTIKNQLVFYKKDIDIEHLKYCYNDESLAFNSPVQIVICADLLRQSYKYSNLGYRLTLIEAGHAAQNICLYCTEQGLATCELGGILDSPLSMELELDTEKISPLLAVAIGYEADTPIINQQEYLFDTIKSIRDDISIISEYGIHSLGDNASFFGAWAKLKNCDIYTGATGYSYYSAISKAIIEAYERYRSSQMRVDYTGKANLSTKRFVLPDELAPLSKEQRINLGLDLFCVDDKIEWTLDITNHYFIPSDYVYYGMKKEKRLFRSTSSGVAAFTDYEEAKKRALLELIERDALMRTWYSKKPPLHVDENSLSFHVKKRIAHWKKQNRFVHVLDLGSAYLPSILVLIVSEQYPCFVCGSASTFAFINDAVEKALHEAEYNLLLSLKYPCKRCPNFSEVQRPVDHGNFYHFKNNADQLEWLFSNNSSINYNNNSITVDFEKLCNNLDAIFVDLSENSNSPIKVVRAISKKLIPISFGAGADYYLHPEIQRLNNVKFDKKLPHFFA